MTVYVTLYNYNDENNAEGVDMYEIIPVLIGMIFGAIIVWFSIIEKLEEASELNTSNQEIITQLKHEYEIESRKAMEFNNENIILKERISGLLDKVLKYEELQTNFESLKEKNNDLDNTIAELMLETLQKESYLLSNDEKFKSMIMHEIKENMYH